MGASNALDAFRLYSAKVPATAMSALAFMALVSMDKDDEPWFQMGYEAIAVTALGREPVTETGDAKADARAQKAMEVACERALRPLFENGAITTVERSSGRPGKSRHAKYRLWLVKPAPDDKRDPRHRSDKSAPYENRGVHNPVPEDPASYGNRRVPDASALRNSCQHPTETVPVPYENRRAKEYEEYEERSKNLEEYSLLSSDSVPVRAREAPDESDDEAMPVRVIPPRRAARAAEPAIPAGTPPPWLSAECPFCGAEPGKPCVNGGTGQPRPPHDARAAPAAKAS